MWNREPRSNRSECGCRGQKSKLLLKGCRGDEGARGREKGEIVGEFAEIRGGREQFAMMNH